VVATLPALFIGVSYPLRTCCLLSC
jgi:hypothetical protein